MIMTYTGRKPIRGHAKEFHALDNEIKWLRCHLGNAIVRGTDDVTYGSVDVMRSLIHQKTDQIEKISTLED